MKDAVASTDIRPRSTIRLNVEASGQRNQGQFVFAGGEGPRLSRAETPGLKRDVFSTRALRGNGKNAVRVRRVVGWANQQVLVGVLHLGVYLRRVPRTGVDAEDRPVRDPASTSVVGAIERAEPFGARIYDEAVRRGLYRAQRVVTLSDGAEWAKNLADTPFPNATHLIDYHHAAEHVVRLTKLLYERNPRFIEPQLERWKTALYEGEVQRVIDQASALLPRAPDAMKDARKGIAYLEKNKERMRYDQYRAQHLFIGSGVIEAGCKHLVGQRLKQSGMEWTVQGANAIVAFPCATLSNRIEDFREQRTA